MARLRKKVVKKKVSEKEIKNYSKRIEKIYKKEGSTLTRQVEFINSIKRFTEGDIFNMYYPDLGCLSMLPECYYDEITRQQTNIPVKYKVVYVDSEGFPHYIKIMEDGSHSGYISNLSDSIQDMIYDGFHLDRDYDPTLAFQLDPEFLDATLLCDENYDPLASLRKVHEENEAALKEECENWWKLKELNKAYRVYTGSKRGREAFRKKYNVGDIVYSEQHGKLTIKIMQDDIVVMHDGANIIAFDDALLKNTVFFREKPKCLYIDIYYSTLKKYKPKNSKTESK